MAADVVPEFAAAALAVVRDGLAVLVGVRHAALSAGELRALSREITALQGTLASAGFRTLAAMDARDDVVPKARAGMASIAFQQHALGVDHHTARRDSTTAQLLDPDTGDLKVMGAAYAAGKVLRGHVDVAVRAHRDLGEKIREELIPVEGEAGGGGWVRRVEAVDALLAEKSRAWSVRELDRFARALVEELNPKTPAGAHERRFLYASPDANGNLVGKFACAATQGALILAVLAAGNAPRPGLAIDPDGVERVLPDRRDLGQRNLDALTDCLALGAARAGITLPPARGPAPTPNPGPTPSANPTSEPTSRRTTSRRTSSRRRKATTGGAGAGGAVRAVPAGEDPLTVGVDQFAARLAKAAGPVQDPNVAWSFISVPIRRSRRRPHRRHHLSETVERMAGRAWIQHAGHPPDPTLAELFARARLQRVLHTPDGAVLAMGRTVRLATPAQKDALITRDVGCVIPGCAVPGEHCEVHHVTPWAAGGATDVQNMPCSARGTTPK